jgi:hypothetical protein
VLAVSVWPWVAVPLIVGRAVFDGGAVETTTSCSTELVLFTASVTVRVTYFVPVPWNVKSMV